MFPRGMATVESYLPFIVYGRPVEVLSVYRFLKDKTRLIVKRWPLGVSTIELKCLVDALRRYYSSFMRSILVLCIDSFLSGNREAKATSYVYFRHGCSNVQSSWIRLDSSFRLEDL